MYYNRSVVNYQILVEYMSQSKEKKTAGEYLGFRKRKGKSAGKIKRQRVS
jgi:hypothetical protein